MSEEDFLLSEPIKKKLEIEIDIDTSKNGVMHAKVHRYESWMQLADAIDAFRIFPRLFILSYLWILIRSVEWFMKLSSPNMEQAGLISVVVGAGAAWFGLYVSSGSVRNAQKFKVTQ